MNKKNNHRRDVSVEIKKPPLEKKTIEENLKEKKKLTITKGTSLCIAIVTVVTVMALGVYHLIVRNSDMLFMAQSEAFFTSNSSFLSECMHHPGGFISWVASFLTQFFYHPALGSSIMIALWLVSILISIWAFKVKAA